MSAYTPKSSPPPRDIVLNEEKDLLEVIFQDHQPFEFSAEFLRVHSPSAEVKGHGSEERKILGGKKQITIRDISMVGNYAIKLVFSDGHDTGIYSWDYLLEIGNNKKHLWEAYLKDLADKNLKREP